MPHPIFEIGDTVQLVNGTSDDVGTISYIGQYTRLGRMYHVKFPNEEVQLSGKLLKRILTNEKTNSIEEDIAHLPPHRLRTLILHLSTLSDQNVNAITTFASMSHLFPED